MTRSTPTLEAAINRLYEAFSAVPRPHHIEGCPCCIDRKDISTLLGKDIRDLAPHELSSYASSAFLTVGDRADYLYFLPRILEVSATESAWWPFPEVTGRAIQSAEPVTWTSAQREALDNFLAAVVDAAIVTKTHDRLDDWICAVARMGFDVRPYLDRVALSPEAVLALFEDNADSLPRAQVVERLLGASLSGP